MAPQNFPAHREHNQQGHRGKGVAFLDKVAETDVDLVRRGVTGELRRQVVLVSIFRVETDGRRLNIPIGDSGALERDDVDQVINQLLTMYPGQTKQLVLFGASLGAAVAIATAGRRADVMALILESPFTDYSKAIEMHAKLSGLDGGLLIRPAIWMSQKISGADFGQVIGCGTIVRQSFGKGQRRCASPAGALKTG